MYFISLPFLVRKIFTFYVNDVLLFKFHFQGQRVNIVSHLLFTVTQSFDLFFSLKLLRTSLNELQVSSHSEINWGNQWDWGLACGRRPSIMSTITITNAKQMYDWCFESNQPASVFDKRIFGGVPLRKQYNLLEKDQTDMTQNRV